MGGGFSKGLTPRKNAVVTKSSKRDRLGGRRGIKNSLKVAQGKASRRSAEGTWAQRDSTIHSPPNTLRIVQGCREGGSGCALIQIDWFPARWTDKPGPEPLGL